MWGVYVGTVDKDRVKWQDEQLDSEFTDDIYSAIYSKRNGYFSIVENDPETVNVDLAVESGWRGTAFLLSTWAQIFCLGLARE